MRTGLILFFVVVFSFCNRTKNEVIMEDLNELEKRLYQHVLFLTDIKPARNYANLNSLNKAAEYIHTSFLKLNGKTEIQTFKVDGKEYKNIITSFGPPEASRIVVGAHYDVAGETPGADDNASAVAGLLELAQMVSNKKDQLKQRIDFVAYSLEEPPYFASDNMGSAIHAKSLKANNIPVKAMICLEMIGYFSDKPGSQNFPDERLSKLYPNTGNFIIVVGKKGQEDFTTKVKGLMKENSIIDVQSINLPDSDYLAGLSDHRNYWRYGYNSVMINDTSFLRNENYHRKSDTIDTLNFKKMGEVVRGVLGVIMSL